MDTIFASLMKAIEATSALEWFAFVTSFTYVILAAKENIWCWFFGLISVIAFFKVCVDYKLYSDAILQVFYMVMSIYGWINWRKAAKSTQDSGILDSPDSLDKLKISVWPTKNHLIAFGIGAILAMFLGYFWTQFGAALPYIDAFTTSFSIIATVMVAWKLLENWLYWIVIDIVGVFVYFNRELYLFSLLFIIYTVIAIVGYLNWKKQYQLNLKSA